MLGLAGLPLDVRVLILLEPLRSSYLALDALAAAPSLRTLRILTIPSEGDLEFGVHDNEGPATFVAATLCVHATEYLARCTTLNALSTCHDVRAPDKEDYFSGELLLEPMFYGRGRVTDAYGRTQVVALEMLQWSIQEVEPVSEIFYLNPAGWRMMRYGCSP
ncbi:hypothetical protein B0A55_08382 [Friedmanniomyces simplex]|uniref:Uncharacterized protein n=1 Tax=Friedmanniomyces simplex TaxID=329884 RepID=A0A4U0WYV8_9PEZI|nr:hypothetical protein B0A55_08382 [Friedmanniomyces simplex]